MRKIAFCLLMFCAVSSLSAQNMNRYITLTSFKGESCFLVFDAGKTNPVKVVNGSTSKTYTDTSICELDFEDAVVTVYGDVTTLQVYGTLDAIDLSHNNILGSLICLGSSLYTLNLKNCTALQTLYCSSNHLSSLDISSNTSLVYLDCSYNELSSLDVSKNTALAHLDCRDNKLSSLDISSNSSLVYLSCSSNQLSSLDISKSTALTRLNCSDNNLSSLDISKNTALTHLDCSFNSISTLDVGTNTALDTLYCIYNQLSSLDVSNNTALTMLDCGSNEISSLDLKRNRALKYLSCSFNDLSSLDVSKNKSLTLLRCCYNSILTLDVSNNILLERLECRSCGLTSLDVSNNKALNFLLCSKNAFGVAEYDNIMCDLPVRTGEAIFHPMTESSDDNYAIFMASNSKNASAKGWTVSYYFENKPIPATQGKYICPPEMGRYVTMGVKVGKEIKLSLSSRAASVAVRVVCGSLDTTLVVSNSGKEFKFTASAGTVTVYGNLFIFSCSNNGSNITSLDVSNNAELVRLVCENNRITGLDLSKNSGLRALACNGNPFTTGAYDDMMCSLPDVTDAGGGALTPLKDSLDDRYSTFMAANSANATDKGWRVLYRTGLRDIPATSGSYGCPGVAVRETTVESAVRVWPNPARTQLHIAGAAGELRVHDLTGRVVYRAEAGDDEIVVNIADWAKGMYFVRSGRQILKFVKE